MKILGKIWLMQSLDGCISILGLNANISYTLEGSKVLFMIGICLVTI